MIRLSARRYSDDGGYVYRIDLAGRETFVTGNEKDVLGRLRQVGVESPELAIAEARQWEEIEIHPPRDIFTGK